MGNSIFWVYIIVRSSMSLSKSSVVGVIVDALACVNVGVAVALVGFVKLSCIFGCCRHC